MKYKGLSVKKAIDLIGDIEDACEKKFKGGERAFFRCVLHDIQALHKNVKRGIAARKK